MLLDELPDEDCRLEPVTEGHAVVHQDQRVGRPVHLKALLDEVDRIAPIKGCITLEAELVQDALGGHSAERVVVDEQDLGMAYLLLLLLGLAVLKRGGHFVAL